MNDLDLGLRAWQLVRAFDWKLPPSVLLNEPESLLSDVMTIEAEYQRLKDMLKNG